MTYRLSVNSTLQAGTNEVVADQIEKAITSLSGAKDDLEGAIHDARKRFKKIRALARLVRQGLGDRYDGINHFYRDLGRQLSDVRDAQVLVETFKIKVVSELDDELNADLINDIGAWVEDNRSRALSGRSVEDRVASVCAELDGASGTLNVWKLGGKPHRILHKGLKKTYRRGRKALAAANRSPDAERLHEWRKRVKYHWYHCRLMREAWPRLMRARADGLDELADDLGDDHDLSVMVDRARNDGAANLGLEHLQLIENAARKQQRNLRGKALRLGPKIYQEKPGDHADRIVGYWKLARAQQD